MKVCIFDLANSPCVWGDNTVTPTLNHNDAIIKCNLTRQFTIDGNGYILNASGNQILYNNGTLTLPLKLVKTREEHIADSHVINPSLILSNFVADSSSMTDSPNLNEINPTYGICTNSFLLKNNQSKLLFFRLNEEPVSSSYFTIEMFGFSKILSSKKVIQKLYIYHNTFTTTDNGGSEDVNGELFNEKYGVFLAYMTCVNSLSYNLDFFDVNKQFIGITVYHTTFYPGLPYDSVIFLGLNQNVDTKYYASTKDGYIRRTILNNFIPTIANEKGPNVSVPYSYFGEVSKVKREIQVSKTGIGIKSYFADDFPAGTNWLVDYKGNEYQIDKYYSTYFDDVEFGTGVKRFIPSSIMIPANIGISGSGINTTNMRSGYISEIGF